MSRRKMPAHLSSLYLTMLMSDIDFSRMSAKASDKGPPYGGGCLLKHHPSHDAVRHQSVSAEWTDDVRIRTSRPDPRAATAAADAGSPPGGAVHRSARTPAHPRSGRTGELRAPSRWLQPPAGTDSTGWTGRATRPCRRTGSTRSARGLGGPGRTTRRARSGAQGWRYGRSPSAWQQSLPLSWASPADAGSGL